MATSVDLTRKLVVITADNSTSKIKQRRFNFAGLSETASPEAILKAGKALASLIKYPLVSIMVSDTNEIIYDESDLAGANA